MTDSRLSVSNLCVDYPEFRVVNDVSFTLSNECLALVGESGSGKSMTARALIGLVRKPDVVTVDTLNVLERDVLIPNARGWQQSRDNDIATVLQDPRYALSLVKTVKARLEEVLTLHQRLDRREKEEKINTTIQAIGLNTQALQSHPHELSGDTGQQAMIAIALINDPRVLIADESTSALDMRLRSQILELLVTRYEQHQMAMLLIGHDLPLVAQFCHRVLVMHQGNKVDETYATALPTAMHPHTRTLWTCHPNV